MIKLLSTDFKRILKDKLFFTACIIGLAFAVITPLLYKGLSSVMEYAVGEGSEEVSELVGLTLSAKTVFFGSFGLTNNFGLILPILLGIVVCKDFSYGTIRNKIISGIPREKIYFSMYISTVAVMFATALAHALVSFLLSLALFGYGAHGGAGEEILYVAQSLAFEILAYAAVGAVMTFLAAAIGSGGLVVVLYAAAVFVFMIAGAVLAATAGGIRLGGGSEAQSELLTTIANILPIYGSSSLIGSAEYGVKEVLELVLSPVAVAVGMTAAGMAIFTKKDLK